MFFLRQFSQLKQTVQRLRYTKFLLLFSNDVNKGLDEMKATFSIGYILLCRLASTLQRLLSLS